MMQHKQTLALAALLATAALLPAFEVAAGGPPTFGGIGYLPGATGSKANAVSADGRVVVGSAGGWPDSQAIRWTAGGGMQGLGAGLGNTMARAVSADGAVIIGGSGGTIFGLNAWRWTEGGGMTELGPFSNPAYSGSDATGVSADGSVVVGYYMTSIENEFEHTVVWTSHPFRQSAGGIEDVLGPYIGDPVGVSADGSIVLGRASRWTVTGGTQTFPEWEHCSFQALSGNGAVGAGVSLDQGAYSRPFFWSEAGGVTYIDGIAGAEWTTLTALSEDGSVIVGTAVYDVPLGLDELPDGDAFIWTAEGGTRLLADILANDYGLDLTGWTLNQATGISADGRTIVGNGIGPVGVQQGWIVTLPEPATLALLAAGGLLLRRRRS